MYTTIDWLQRHGVLVTIGSGVIMGIAFIVPALWWLGLGGIVLQTYGLRYVSSVPSVLVSGWLAWSSMYACAISWFWSTYPLDWFVPLPPEQQLIAIGVIWATCSLALGSGGAVYGLFVQQATRRWRWWLLAAPGVWLGAQLLGSLVFSIFSIGPSVVPNTAFSFGYVGYLLAEHSTFIQLADLGGVYLLTLVYVGLALAVWRLLVRQSNMQWRVGVLAGVGLVLAAGALPLQPSVAPTQGYTVAVVDTSYRSKDERTPERTAALRTAIAAALDEQVTHIVLPEDARFTTAFPSQAAAAQWFQFQRGFATTTLIDTSTVSVSDGSAVRGFIYDGAGREEYVLDKRYLVPQGEFVPYLAGAFLDWIGRADLRQRAEAQMSYRASSTSPSSVAAAHVPGVMFCFESVMPYAARQITNERAVPFIVHPISHGWFHEPEQLWPQLEQMLRVQAIWNDVSIVSAANLATGKHYTPVGGVELPRVVASSTHWQVGLFEL